MLFGSVSDAKEWSVQGPIYTIQEQDALEWIELRLQELKASGEIERQQEKWKARVMSSLHRPVPVKGLKRTTKPRQFEHDLTVKVSEDLRDASGRLIHAAGTEIKPLALLSTKKSLLFLDGDDAEQVVWGLQEYQKRAEQAKLVLVNGPVIDLMRERGVRFYFDQAGRLIRHFKIEQVPAIVESLGDKLQISEVKL